MRRPRLEGLEERIVLTDFTMTSPTALGALPSWVAPVGGLVLDLVGVNGQRVVSQVPADQLFQGDFHHGTPAEYRGNPGTIGILNGLTPQVIDALGGGLAELAVRVTLHDGDNGPQEFDRDDNTLLLDGIDLGNFSRVVTQETDPNGANALSFNADGGFRHNRLDTGFFHVNDADILASVRDLIQSTGTLRFQFLDADPADNLIDFTQGVLPAANQPPVIVAVHAADPVPAGGLARLHVVATDPDGFDALLTYAFDVVGDGQPEFLSTSPTFEFLVGAPGPVTVAVRVMDPNGGAVTTLLRFTVVDPAPTVDPPADQQADEGTSADFDLGTLTDLSQPQQSGWTITVDWGDGSPAETFNVTETGNLGARPHTYAQDGRYNVTVTAFDGAETGSASFAVDVRNVAPTLTTPPRQESDEGASTAFDLGSLFDPGAEASWTISVDWGDGSPVDIFTVSTTGDLGDREHAYAQDGNYTVTVTAFDGTATGVANFVVDVRNVAPTLTPPPRQESDEGTSTAFVLGTLADPGAEVGWTITVDWGDGSPIESFTVTTIGNLNPREHTYTQDGRYNVTVTADDGAGIGSASFAVDVRNVPPTLTPPIDQQADEGASTVFDLGSLLDPGAEAGWTITIDWGDGSPVETFNAIETGDLGSRPHSYAQDGRYNVTMMASDGLATGVANFVVDVRNVAPTLTPPPRQESDEGAATAFDLGMLADPGIEAEWTITIDWGDGSPVETFNATETGDLGSREHAYAQDGRYNVTVTAFDGTAAGAVSFAVDVHNVAPTLGSPIDQQTDEGTATDFHLGTLADPGAEAGWTITVNWGDGSPADTFTVHEAGDLGSRAHAYAQDGPYTVTVTASDGAATGVARFVVDVRNVDPTLTPPVDQQADEGTSTAFDLGTLFDPGAEAGWLITVDWGDGSPAETFTVDATGDLGDHAHTYAQDGRYTVAVTAFDGTGIGSARFGVDVRNVAPTLTATAGQGADEGASTAFHLGTLADPGAEAGWTITVNWGDGSAIETFVVNATGDLGSREHGYAQDGVWVITVTASDGSASHSVTSEVVVGNLPPSIDALSFPGTLLRGERARLALRVSDPGVLDALRLTVDWGEGTTVTEPLDPGATAAVLGQVYAVAPGVYQVTITLEDDAGASVQQVLSVVVRGRVPAEEPLFLAPSGPQVLASFAEPARSNAPLAERELVGAGRANQEVPAAAPELAMAASPGSGEEAPEDQAPEDQGSSAAGGGGGPGAAVAVAEVESDSAVVVAAPPAVEAPAASPAGEGAAPAEAAVTPMVADASPEPDPRHSGGAIMTAIMVVAAVRQRQPRFRPRHLARAGGPGR